MASTDRLRRRLDELRWDDRGSARTKLLAALVAVMTVAGVVSLVLVLTGRDNQSSGTVAQQPAGSQVGRQSSSAPTSAATGVAPTSVSPTSAAPTSVPATSTAPTAPASTTEPVSTAASPTKPITYTVKKGDNLTVIAAWFHQHGYGALYERNKDVIGDNPNLIFAGQRITVSRAGVSLDGK